MFPNRMEIFAAFIIGIAAGAGLAFFLFQRRFHQQRQQLEVVSMQALELEKKQMETFQSLSAEIRIREQKNQFTEERLKAAQESLKSYQQAQDEVLKRTTLQFENLANRIFEEKSSRFVNQNLENLNTVLSPLKEKLKDFEKKVEESYSTERSERGVLRGEIGKLIELNQVMSREAKNLTNALKGENKTQGNWGELILENILERSGLRKGAEFIVQGTDMDIRGADGGLLKPDVVVLLPENKHLVVDSKMTLNAYEAYTASDILEEKEQQAKLFIDSLRRHIEGLSGKQYHLAENLISPDFVLLFMPLEPAFSLAFQIRPEIFQEAWEKNIAIVSPTTLLTSLRTVSVLWKQDRQQKNALDIAKRGGALYDKFVGFIKDFEDLGQQIDDTKKSFQLISAKLSTGKGNLVRQVETLKELGAKAEKSLPSSRLEEAMDVTIEESSVESLPPASEKNIEEIKESQIES